MNEKEHKRFLKRVDKTTNEKGCWVWTGHTNKHGYGQMAIEGYAHYVHRLSYEHYHGPLGNLDVCHRCDNPPCVNPEHLFAGSASENAYDAKSKGRIQCKLTIEQVMEIKRLLTYPHLTQKEIGQRFGVTQGLIKNIKLGRAWKDVVYVEESKGKE